MYSLFRPLLFKLDPETVHHLTLQLIRLGAYQPFNLGLQAIYHTPEKPVKAFGLHFQNPVGLAAGYDKDGLAWRGLATLGFGHIEIGTVTPKPQEGNPKPRIFRLVEDQAVINRMGFPGLGADYVAKRLRSHNNKHVILGVNLGKNKDTPLENAAHDYTELLQQFMPLADYLAINVSSPNTVGLRRLQGRDLLEGLLGAISKQRQEMVATNEMKRVPILVKLAPDLSEEELDDALDAIVSNGMDGVIATNTTLERKGLRSKLAEEVGGLSGAPLRQRSEDILRRVVKRLDGRLPIVSAGGIMRPEDARIRLEAGATLVQVYTGLVYSGPSLVKQIVRKL
jgi:dihydroorotate dehydrogenase